MTYTASFLPAPGKNALTGDPKYWNGRGARMHIELDHLFICTAPGAPEGEELVRFGLREGPANIHPGQGTANRRFAFANAMIELLWVSDAKEAQSESPRRTLLWERWSGREGGASPFGICLRPVDSQNQELPFEGWEYRPAYLPDPFVMHIGEAGVEEPMWVYLNFMRGPDREHHFVDHPAGIREITSLILTTPVPLQSTVSHRLVEREFYQRKKDQNLSSILDSTAVTAKRSWISGHTYLSSFNCE